MAKQVFCVFLLASLAVLASSFPSEGNFWRESFNRPARADDVVIVPLENRNREAVEDSSEDDYGESYPSPWSNSFGSFFQGMQAMLKQLRNQMQEVLSRMPQEPYDSTNGTSVMIFPSWDSLPGNSTSTTKVINGHVVTVNETTYKQGSDGSSAVFHIRVVDIKPEETGTKIEDSSEEVETVEDAWDSNPSSLSNEDMRPSQTLKWFSQLKRPSTSFGGVDSKRFYKKPVSRRQYVPQPKEVPDSMNRIDDSVEVIVKKNEAERNSDQVIDLSRDTLVNKLMSDQQKKGGIIALHPDVELLDISNGKVIGESEDAYLQQKVQKPELHRGFWE